MPAVILSLLFCLTFGCKKTDPDDDPIDNSPPPNRHLQVTVHHLVVIDSTVTDTLVPDVSLLLYLTEEDREFDWDRQRTGKTDSAGEVKFLHLKHDLYYIKASHPILGDTLFEEQTPLNSTSYSTVWFN